MKKLVLVFLPLVLAGYSSSAVPASEAGPPETPAPQSAPPEMAPPESTPPEGALAEDAPEMLVTRSYPPCATEPYTAWDGGRGPWCGWVYPRNLFCRPRDICRGFPNGPPNNGSGIGECCSVLPTYMAWSGARGPACGSERRYRLGGHFMVGRSCLPGDRCDYPHVGRCIAIGGG